MHIRCTTHAYAICILLASAGAVQADVWDEFVEACLAPLEEVRLVPPVHLPQVGAYKNDGNTYQAFALSAGATLRVSDRLVWPQWCTLLVEGETQVVEVRFSEWADNFAPDRGYVAIEPEEAGIANDAIVAAFRSNGWREPRLDVILFVHPDQDWLSVRVADTNLESRG